MIEECVEDPFCNRKQGCNPQNKVVMDILPQLKLSLVDPNKIDPTSMSNTYTVFDNLHMQWMGIWMCPYHIMAALIDQVFGSHLKFWVTPGQQLMVKCGD